MTGLIIPGLLQRTMHFSGVLSSSCWRNLDWVCHYHTTVSPRCGWTCPYLKHSRDCFVFGIQRRQGPQRRHKKIPLQESQLLFAIQDLCYRGEKPSLALVSSAVTPLMLSQAWSKREKLWFKLFSARQGFSLQYLSKRGRETFYMSR